MFDHPSDSTTGHVFVIDPIRPRTGTILDTISTVPFSGVIYDVSGVQSDVPQFE
jgi:hypothetical protein